MSIRSNPRAIVTGGASGLGRAFCLELARRGGKILVADRDLSGAEQTAQQVVALGARAEAVSCDVAELANVERLAASADQFFGGVDLVVNNAGVAVSGQIGDVPVTDWEWILRINLWGVIYGCHVFAPRFRALRSGHILNVASAAGLLCSPDMGPYNVTKAGVIALSETLYSELQPFGVGVTVLCPTFFKTNIIAGARATEQSALIGAFVEKLSSQSKIQAGDVARIALESCDAGRLYSVPMADGQWAWRIKRVAPGLYYRKVFPKVRDYYAKKLRAL